MTYTAIHFISLEVTGAIITHVVLFINAICSLQDKILTQAGLTAC